MDNQLIASFVLIALFFAGMIHDLRKRELPPGLTLGALVGAGVYALFQGLWIPVLLVFALLMADNLELRSKWLAFAVTLTVAAFFVQPEVALIGAVTIAAWILWECGMLGGADVKLLAAALLVLGTPLVLVPIALVGGIQGLIAALQKKREIPFAVSIFCGSLFFVVYPYF